MKSKSEVECAPVRGISEPIWKCDFIKWKPSLDTSNGRGSAHHG